MPNLPPWDDSMSDGCSVPRWLRFAIPLETPEEQAVCRTHDRAYYYGGTARERAIADATFLLGLLASSMEVSAAERYYQAVRLFGGPEWKQKGVSWAFGGERFCYD